MDSQLESLILAVLADVRTEQSPSDADAITRETRLFGRGGLFDSLGLVTFVVAVEQAIEDQLGLSVSLADERAMSQTKSPYRSVASLAEYARLVIESGR
jgi:acyl carrier protein